MAEPRGTADQILVVEDEADIRELLSLLILRQGHTVKQCSSGAQALQVLTSELSRPFDLVILDWMLPDLPGIEVLQAIRKQGSAIPVLMVTAKADPDSIVQGLEAGADDYVTKPFDPAILTARIKALLRRAQEKVPEDSGEIDVLRFGGLSLNLQTYEVRCYDEELHLTPSEFKILSYMAQNQGRVMTREQLITVAQGEGVTVTGRTIDTHVFGLRKKLGPCADWIETIRGVGYRIK